MPAVSCDRLLVQVTPEVLNRQSVKRAATAVHRVPAFTRTLDDLAEVLAEHWKTYQERSETEGATVCLGDFALYLLVAASREPFFVEVP